MDERLPDDYPHSIIGVLSFSKRLLVWDAYRCHTSEAVRTETSRMRLHTAIVPGGCTKYIQAADVVWNACFKSHMQSCYNTWLADPDCHEYTRGGNLKPPSHFLLCEWVKSSWQAVIDEMVKESFISCAITANTTGCDDGKIHCFRSGQPCERGRSLLDTKTWKLLTAPMDNEHNDPFASGSWNEWSLDWWRGYILFIEARMKLKSLRMMLCNTI